MSFPAGSFHCRVNSTWSSAQKFRSGPTVRALIRAPGSSQIKPMTSHSQARISFTRVPPLYRVDVGKEVFYALDEGERTGILDRIEAEKKRGKVTVTRFKGLGEMNPSQLRETTMNRDTRRLVQLTIKSKDNVDQLMDMLLAKKRSKDRRKWLESKGDLAEV